MKFSMEDLCNKLIRSESEADVRKVLEQHGLWDDDDCWHAYGNNPDNWSTVNNQQASPDNALVEILVNSCDANLIRACRSRGIDPSDSEAAPKSISQAKEILFGISKPDFSEFTDAQVTKLAIQNCGLVATGSRENPSYGIFDFGEGQAPQDFPKTFLSLHGGNKKSVPFVQGKFNQGSTGVILFCGEECFKFIASKRCPEIKDGKPDNWGFTIIRRKRPTVQSGLKTSAAEYLVIDGKIPEFNADGLFVVPDDKNAYGKPLPWGSYVKLYEYQLKKAQRSNITLDLAYRLSALLVDAILPIRLYESRDYRGHSPEANLNGLRHRLRTDRGENIEEGFPVDGTFKTSLGQFHYQIFVLKAEAKQSRFSGPDGVIFTVNGQSHGTLSRSFFAKAGKGYLKESLIVLVDCSGLSYVKSEDLFKTSRDRLARNEDSEAIEKKLLDIIRDDDRLKQLQNERHRKRVTDKVGDTKLAEDVFKKILKHSPSLQKFLVLGQRMPGRTFGPDDSPIEMEFVGKASPTFFREKNPTEESKPKSCQVSRSARLQFLTDAANDYLSRSLYPGSFTFDCDDAPVNEWANIIKLNEGVLTLQLDVPEDFSVDTILKVECRLVDETMVDALTTSSFLKIESLRKSEPSDTPRQRRPPKKARDLQLPPIQDVRRDEWGQYKFDANSALTVIQNEETYDFFVNMDNKYLLNEIKHNHKIEKEILEYRFKFALFFLVFPLINEHFSKEFNFDDDRDKEADIRKFSSVCAAIVLPLIEALSTSDLVLAAEGED